MSTLAQTTFDTAACKVGLVHVGYGAFHRAHQAVYLDDYMQATGDLRWGIAAVNLRASESAAFATAAGARGGYVLKSIASDGQITFRTVRSHLRFVDAAQDLQAALDLVAQDSVQALSMTITESAYAYRPDWTLDLEAPEIAAEIDGAPGSSRVRTIYGFLAAALARRAEAGAPITVLCCDNIRSNGKLLRAATLRYLEAKGLMDLATWVQAHVTFPCSMVDRITPRSTPALSDEIAATFPDHATAPVHAEDFLQWVLQDHFAAAFPDLTKVGVQVVDDVEPFEEAKIRILNGGHTGLCYLGALAGHQTFDQAMADPKLRAHFDRWEEEVLLGLDGLIPFDTAAYRDAVAARFGNAGIADQLERICMDGTSKMGLFIRPTLEACLRQGRMPEAGFDCVASWVVYARKIQAGTMPIPYHDPFWDAVSDRLAPGREGDLATDPQLWGDLPQTHAGFVPGLIAAIQQMDTTWQA